jgi:hypothetical protein
MAPGLDWQRRMSKVTGRSKRISARIAPKCPHSSGHCPKLHHSPQILGTQCCLGKYCMPPCQKPDDSACGSRGAQSRACAPGSRQPTGIPSPSHQAQTQLTCHARSPQIDAPGRSAGSTNRILGRPVLASRPFFDRCFPVAGLISAMKRKITLAWQTWGKRRPSSIHPFHQEKRPTKGQAQSRARHTRAL